MSQEYFIISGKSSIGPYDIVMLVKKIRNGTLTAATLLKGSNDSPAKPAHEWTILSEFFQEIVDDKSDAGQSGHVHRSLAQTLQNGWRFLQRNQVSTLFSGILVLVIIMLLGITTLVLPSSMHVFAYIVCFVLGHFLLSCYMLIVLRMSRGQPVDISYIKDKVGPAAWQLALSSLMVSFIAIIGLVLLASSTMLPVALFGLFILAGPGLFILALYSFAPLLMLDQKYDFWEAMETSRKAVLKSGTENAGIIYALFVINFIAGLFVLLPMAITLPITLSALCEIYDEMFA